MLPATVFLDHECNLTGAATSAVQRNGRTRYAKVCTTLLAANAAVVVYKLIPESAAGAVYNKRWRCGGVPDAKDRCDYHY